MSRGRATDVRDAALRRLGWANRTMLVSSLALTGVLADVTASSFHHSTQAGGAALGRHGRRPANHVTTKKAKAPLRPPAEAPKAVEHEATAAPVEGSSSPPVEEATAPPPEETHSEAAAQATHEAAPEPPPVQEPEPVVTGAS
jgi:hypothetical protein